jgi:hypothetical protein
MRLLKSFLSLALIIVASCGPSNNPSEVVADQPKSEGEIRDELYQEVIEIHDVAMLKMQTIVNLKSLTIKEADSLRDLGDESLNGRIAELVRNEETLESANKKMMVWMRAFRPPADTLSHEVVMKYLRSEQDKIILVDNDMDKAISNAKSL